jgi:phenol hydroxylase P2 protein
VEEQMGRAFNLQELHINLITLTGHIEETDDEFTLSWAH